ncbi:MAG: S-layer homology domain-containing protein, partial [Candidatus Peribacteraceae bacterium]|nr:S-layer homology domain-containing protein [Candidatus Peribacteraceae bacterium]
KSAQGMWSAAYVSKAESLQLSVFAPALDVNKPATRGAVIQTLLEVLGIPTGPKAETSYTDVPSSHPYARAIAMATYLELVSGDLDASGHPLNRFRPDEPINRAEVAKIIALAKELSK